MNVHPAQLAEIRRVVSEVRAVDPEDADLMADSLEGETDIMEIVGGLIEEMDHFEADADTCKAMAARYTDRARTLSEKAAARKATLGRIRQIVGSNIKHALATVSLTHRKSAPEKASDFDVDALPDDLVRLKREPDAAAIRAAMEGGRNVPGYQWSGETESVSIRRK